MDSQAQATLGHKFMSRSVHAVDRARHGIKNLQIRFVTLRRSFDFQISKADMGDGATCLFLRNDDLFGRPQLYGNGNQDYEDNHIRFFQLPFELVRTDWHQILFTAMTGRQGWFQLSTA